MLLSVTIRTTGKEWMPPMLKSLQRNFLILTMTLLAIVLFGAYAFSYTYYMLCCPA